MLTLYGNHATDVDGKVPFSVQVKTFLYIIAVLCRAGREGGREGEETN